MKNLTKLVVLFFAALVSNPLTASCENAKPKDLSQLIDRARKAVVLIEVNDRLGTGVFFTREGHILTALHVLDEQMRIEVAESAERVQVHWVFGGCFPGSLPNYRSCKLPVSVTLLDPEADLAVLKVEQTETWKG
ncbi:MAG: S1C family serine protease, partial [Acidobacteria bacterium]|nr:S1C family serine protease [Acidobacteriota bacterium]